MSRSCSRDAQQLSRMSATRDLAPVDSRGKPWKAGDFTRSHTWKTSLARPLDLPPAFGARARMPLFCMESVYAAHTVMEARRAPMPPLLPALQPPRCAGCFGCHQAARPLCARVAHRARRALADVRAAPRLLTARAHAARRPRLVLCREQARCDRPAQPNRLTGRGWPKLSGQPEA